MSNEWIRNNIMTKRAARWALAVLVVLIVTHIGSNHVSNRVVIDGSTGKPLADVYVLLTFEGDSSAGVESRHLCYRVDAEKTDADGHFHFPLWRRSFNPFLSDVEVGVQFYKAGYQTSEEKPKEGEPFKMIPDSKIARERWDYLNDLFNRSDRCGSSAKLLPAYVAAYDEVKAIAKTVDDYSQLNYRLFYVQKIKLGDSLAGENYKKRKQQLQGPSPDLGKGPLWMPY